MYVLLLTDAKFNNEDEDEIVLPTDTKLADEEAGESTF